MSSSYVVSQLLVKSRDGDQDLRYMALADLIRELEKPNCSVDSNTEEQLVARVLEMLQDNISEVKNQAANTFRFLFALLSAFKHLTLPLCPRVVLDTWSRG